MILGLSVMILVLGFQVQRFKVVQDSRIGFQGWGCWILSFQSYVLGLMILCLLHMPWCFTDNYAA